VVLKEPVGRVVLLAILIDHTRVPETMECLDVRLLKHLSPDIFLYQLRNRCSGVLQGVFAFHLSLGRLPGLGEVVISRSLDYEETLGVKGYALLMNKAGCPQEHSPSFRGVLYIEIALLGVKGQMLLTPYETGLKNI